MYRGIHVVNTALRCDYPSAHVLRGAVSSDGVLLRPLLGDALRVRLVLLVVLRDVGREGVVRVRCAEECLHGEQHRADLQGGRPLVLQDVEAYPASLSVRARGAPSAHVHTPARDEDVGDAPMLGW